MTQGKESPSHQRSSVSWIIVNWVTNSYFFKIMISISMRRKLQITKGIQKNIVSHR